MMMTSHHAAGRTAPADVRRWNLRRVRTYLAVLVLVAGIAGGAACFADSPEGLSGAIDTALDGVSLGNARFGVSVVEMPSQRTVCVRRADEPFRAASNIKLATVAAALEILGPDYVYRTRLYADGGISDGVIDGDLYLVGSGDPTLSARFHKDDCTRPFVRWSRALHDAGLRRVTGDIVADATLFDSEYRHPSWPKGQYLAHYSAEVSALSLNDNVVSIEIANVGEGKPARLTITPPTEYVKLTNAIRPTSSKKKHRYAFYRALDSNEITARGFYLVGAENSTTRVTIHDPAAYAATVFAECLTRQGIRIEGSVRVAGTPTRTTGKRLLISYRSRLADSVSPMLTESVNLYAEMLLKLLGAEKRGSGSFASGGAVVGAYLDKLVPGSTFSVVDGSGLSRENRLTPRILTKILAEMYAGPNRELWLASLPRNGQPGTLSKRMKEPMLAGRVAAKTGYISGTCALSGYCFAEDGRVYAFSFLVNDFPSLREARNAQDRLCRILAGAPR